MDYISRFHIINYNSDKYFILGEIDEYVEHVNVNDNLTVKIEVRRKGEMGPVDYPIITGRIDAISKCIEEGFCTGKKQLVTCFHMHIDFDVIEYIKNVIKELEQK